MDTEAYLAKFTSAYGPSGDEGTISVLLEEELKAYGTAAIDAMHNVICTIPGTGKHYLLDAHLDQIGFVVTGIDEKGFLKVAKVGGVDRRTLLGHEVTVWGKQMLPGIICCQPPHILKADSYQTSIDFADVSIDIGYSKEQAEKLVSLGDRVTLKYQKTSLLNGCCSQSFLDNRSGVVAILLALKKLKEQHCTHKITVLFSSQEEVGTRGATVAAFGQSVDAAITVDVSFATTPGSDPANCGKLGAGPMIGIAPVLCSEIYQGLKTTAEACRIPYQLEVMGETTGTNADVITVAGHGIKTGLISIPQKYMHTPVETVAAADVENTAELIAAYILNKGGAYHA